MDDTSKERASTTVNPEESQSSETEADETTDEECPNDPSYWIFHVNTRITTSTPNVCHTKTVYMPTTRLNRTQLAFLQQASKTAFEVTANNRGVSSNSKHQFLLNLVQFNIYPILPFKCVGMTRVNISRPSSSYT